jgi:hypothetical protein
MIRKDAEGRNTTLKLQYFWNAFTYLYKKDYKDMSIHEKLSVRSFYCGNTAPSLMIKQLIKFNTDPDYIAF